ncbi:unnamed protein product [Urochloa decumbens]|uniref:Uncharacterized protein n=1 Tax=Urochloa decumbens TaxID=240449 RepID=A0ABC9AIF3_9POAL
MPPNSKSSKAAAANTASGRHEFKFEGYSRYKGLANGKAISSGKFRVGGHCWSIPYMPGGYGINGNGNWVFFGLRLHPSDVYDGDVKVEFSLTLLDKDRQPVPFHTSGAVQCIFSSKRCRWGFDQFIKTDELDSLYLKDGCFCIRCDVTVFLETRKEFAVPPPELHQYRGDRLDRRIGGDIKFDVGSETFLAHKKVLAARSPVFKAEFFGCPMKEKAATRVRIHDIEPRVFEAMLDFIYNESVPEIDDRRDKILMAQHLLVAADRYDMERLKSTCEYVLCKSVNKSIAVTTLVLAEQHGCPRLKEACFEILKSPDNYKEALVGHDLEDDLNHLSRSCPSLIKELDEAGLCDLFENIELKQQNS